MTERDGLTVLVIPEGSGAARTLHLSAGKVRLLFGTALLLLLLVAGFLGSWWYLAAQAHRAEQLEAQIELLLQEQVRTGELARQLLEVEAGYERLRAMLGGDSLGSATGVWLPPSGGGGTPPPRVDDEDDGLPTSWPLTERGFITQPLLSGGEGDHPGLDIAVPTGSYIRAAGPGTVAEVGDDPIYGYFVRIEHGSGYETLYAHASLILVESGEGVARNEVIALTGSTGASSAPHLHFEIWREGEPVDPLSLVSPP